VKAGTTALTTAQVIFCDASAAHCTDIHILGTAQLTSAGTATLKFRPGIGTHSYKAVFVGTPNSSPAYASSSSTTSTLIVTGKYPTTTTITQSGNPGDYTLTATVAGPDNEPNAAAPNGTISFLDTSFGNTVLATAALSPGITGLSFLNSQTPTTGDDPWSVATGDFNGDGIPDLAVANYSDSTVTILLGNGDGTFYQATNSPIALNNTTFAVVVGDFNRGGKADLAVLSGYYDGSVTIFLGNGDGTFTQAAGSPTTVGGPYGINDAAAVGDFNGDGILDLAVASDDYVYGPSTVTILLGNGDGTFTPANGGSVTVGEGSISVAVGDFNGDGIPDFATVGFYDATVSIFLGNGDGTFAQAASSPITVGSFPYAISVADFNNDGKTDLAVANSAYTSGSPGTVTILLGNGNGTFTQATDSPVTVGSTPQSVSVGDFNGDGVPDLAVANNGNDTVTILLGSGTGTFTPAMNGPVSTGDFPKSVAVADFTGGGVSDLAVGNENDNVTVLLSEFETATATVNSIAPVGASTHLVDASYPGDSNYAPSISGITSLTAGVATPVISPASGTITSAQYVTLTDTTPGATIYYQASGATYTNGYVQYTTPIPLEGSGPLTIQAYATENDYQQSAYASATYTLNFPSAAATPVISLATGEYPAAQTVTISDTAPGAQIYYTTNGIYPSTYSNLYSGPITVSTSEVIAAYAIAPGYTHSEVASAEYIINSSPSSFIYTVAGNGIYGYAGDGGPATIADLNYPAGIAVVPAGLAGAGNIYIADSVNNVVRMVAAGTGTITTVAGTGIGGYSGDNGPATSAQLWYPSEVAIDSSGNLWICDSENGRIRIVEAATGMIDSVNLNGLYPYGFALGPANNLYVNSDNRIWEVGPTNILIAGSGNSGYAGDGGPATSATLSGPRGIAFDSVGNLYIADTENSVVRKVTRSTGVITTVAGNSSDEGLYGFGYAIFGYSGDGGPATSADLNSPFAVSFDGAGNLYIADTDNSAIRKVTASTGIITTVAGDGEPCFAYGGDGGPATSAALCVPHGISVDGAGDLYIADTDSSRIREVMVSGSAPTTATATPMLSVAAGTYVGSQTVTITDATPAAVIYVTLNPPPSSSTQDLSVPYEVLSAGYYRGPISISGTATLQAVAVAPGYLPSSAVSAAYTITTPPSAIMTTVAGNGVYGFSATGGPATSTPMGVPQGITIDNSGNLYFTDISNNVVWMVAQGTGTMSLVAGNGSYGYSGDNGPAINAQLYGPSAVAVDKAGNLYIADTYNNLVREVAAGTGTITTFAGVYGQPAYPGHNGDGGLASAAYLNYPTGLAFDKSGNLYIADSGEDLVRVISAATGIITTFAGSGDNAETNANNGDGGPATKALVNSPGPLAFDAAGNLYIGEEYGGRVRMVAANTSIITTVAGDGDTGASGDGGLATNAEVWPLGLAVDASGNLYISGYGATVREVKASTGVIASMAGNGFYGYSGDGGSATAAGIKDPLGIAFDASGDLYIADGNYRIREVTFPGPAPAPVFTPAAGTYTSAQTVSITDSVKGATFYYTADGTTPTTASNLYTSSLTVGASETLQAIAVATGYTESPVTSAAYTINLPVTPTVTLTPSANSITTAQPLTITVVVAGSSTQPTGSVTLAGGGYTSAAATLSSGAATITVPAGSLTMGSDTLTVTYTPDSASSTVYATATQSVTVTVTSAIGSATATVTATPSATTITNDQSLTVKIAVAGGSGQATPTGTVTLSSGSYTSQQTLSSGAATFTVAAGTLSSGANSLTVTYSGDPTYAIATATTTVTVAQVTIAIPAPSAVSPGAAATATVTLSAGSNYSGTMNLTCALTSSPNGAQSLPTCSLNPASVTLAAGANGTSTFTVNTTAASNSALARPSRKNLWGLGGGGALLAVVFLVGIPSRRRRWLSMLAIVFIAVAACTIGCGGSGGSGGGGGGNGTPATTAGNYTFTVTGTDSANSKITVSTTVTISVQ
jgi:sugar lactone lactonase YvrE